MRLFVALAMLLLLTGCREATAPPNDVAQPAAQSPSTVANVDPPAAAAARVALVEIPGREPPRFDQLLAEEVAQLSSRASAGGDLAALADKQLQRLAELISQKQPQASEFSALADDAFRCGSLRPSTTQAQRDAVFTVRRGTSTSTWSLAGEHRGAAGLAQAIAEFTRPLATAQPLDTQLAVEQTSTESGALVTQVRLRIVARTAQQTTQTNALWSCRWDLKRRPLKLTAISVQDFEEVTLHGAQPQLFADCTTAVLGKLPAWKEQLTLGVDDWRSRREKPLAPAAIGWQGLAVGDVNGDGRDDLYLCYGAGLPNRLLVQNADGTVSDQSHEAGIDWLDACASALVVDLDNDGDQDLIVAASSQLLVQSNDGQGKFALSQSIALASQPTSLSAADYDADGKLDLLVCGYAPAEKLAASLLGQPATFFGAAGGGANVLLHNEGDGVLRDVTSEVGLHDDFQQFTLASSFEDFDADGDVDLLVANAFGRNRLYRNELGQFEEIAGTADVANRGLTTAAAWSDFNGDGQMDLYLAGFLDSSAANSTSSLSERFRELYGSSNLVEAAGGGAFRRAAPDFRAALAQPLWDARAVDINNDGRDDLVASAGMVTGVRDDDLDGFFWRRVAAQSPPIDGASASPGVRERYKLAWQTMSQGVAQGSSWRGGERGVCLLNVDHQTFAEVSTTSGLDFAGDGRAIAVTDWDGDGDQDLWLTSRTAPSIRFARNDGGGRALMLKLQGVNCNRDAIGARVTARLKPSGRRLVRSLRAGDGFLSQSSKWLHFGLPAGEEIKDVTVAWPGGESETFTGVERGGRLLLVQNSGQPVPVAARGKVQLPSSSSPPPAPPAGASIFLASRLPLPLVKYRNFQEQNVELGQPGQNKTLVLLWGATVEPSVAALAQLAKDSVELRVAGIEVVALAVDEIPTGQLFAPAARDVVQKINPRFATGTASPELLDQLDAVQQTLLALERPLVVPSAMLLDEHGRVAALYRGALNKRRLLDDAAALAGDDSELRRRAVGLAGRWRSEPPPVNPFALVEKLHAGNSPEATSAYVQLLVKQGHDRAAGYERLLPDQLYYMAGTLLEEQNRLEEAAAAYRVVLDVDVQHSLARRRLASIASRLGQHREAADALAVLVAANPDDVSLRHEWAVRLAASGDIKLSIAQHRAVLQREPDAIATANNLAWLLATNPDPEIRRAEEALQIARRVCEATKYQRPDTLDTLAAAYAAAGRMSGAVSTARRALQLAREQRQSAVQIEAIENHLQTYEAGKAVLEAPDREFVYD